jgi:uncharacterized protein YabE (DUF348 family)
MDGATSREIPRWRRRALVIGLLAFAVVAAVPLAATATAPRVTVAADGERHETRIRGGTVADALERLEVTVGAADEVDPPLAAPIVEDLHVTVERAIRVVVVDDAQRHELVAVVGTVGEALDRLEIDVIPEDEVEPPVDAPVTGGSEVTVERAIRVVVVDDGRPDELVAVVATVGEVLDRLGLEVGTADRVAPPPTARVQDGTEVVIERAITVDIAVDGAVARRVTAPLATVEEVLRHAGMADLLDAEVRIDPPADQEVGDGDTITVTFPTPVTVLVDGGETTVATYASDVSGALADAGVELGEDDRVAPPLEAVFVGPLRVTVQRVRQAEETVEVALEHDRERRETGELDRGQTRVEVAGRDGLRIDTYRVTLVDGEETDRERVRQEVVREPRDEVVLVGTRVPPPPPPPPPPASGGGAAGGGASGDAGAGSGGASGSGSSSGQSGGASGSGGTSSQGYLVAPGSNAAGSGPTVTYSVEVEAGLGLDPGSVAATVDAALLDQRSWARDRRMERLSNPSSARIRVLVASPATVDRLCRAVGLDTGGYLSCWTGRFAALNVNRWRNGVPSFSDIGVYRRYLVNHEVGHGLGFGHVGCPAQGALAPVMMQQSISLGGCRPNGWPHPG